MKLKPDRVTLSKWIAVLLFSGLFIWGLKLLKYQLVLSSLNIINKGPCDSTHEKSVIIFLDERAKRSMRRYRVTATKIIAETNGIFAEHGLPNRYDLKNLKLRSWSTESKDCIFRDDFPDKTTCFSNEMMPRYLEERKSGDPDVVIFITATGDSDVSGIAYWNRKNSNGTGSITLNLGVDLKSYDSDEKLKEVARKFFLRRFAHLSAHEQAHLYDLDHSSGTYSIMNAYSSSLGDRRVKFNKESLNALTERNSELREIKNKCAAQK